MARDVALILELARRDDSTSLCHESNPPSMDPLSIAVSAVTLIQTAKHITNGAKMLLDLRKAPKELWAVINEVTDIAITLEMGSEALKYISETGLGTSVQVQSSLERIHVLIARPERLLHELKTLIDEKLTKNGPANSAASIHVAKWAWVRKSKKLSYYQTKIRECHLNLQTAFAALGTVQQHRTYLAVQSLSYAVSPDVQQEISSSTSSTITSNFDQEVPNNQPPEPATVSSSSLNGTLQVGVSSIKPKCTKYCPCRCHRKSQFHTPLWFERVFGTLFCTYTGMPISVASSCTEETCEGGDTSFQLTYFFPSWLVSRAIILSVSLNELSGRGAAICISVPRLIPDTSAVWAAVSSGELDPLKCLFKQGLASPFDIDSEGRTLLRYAISLRKFELFGFLVREGSSATGRDGDGWNAIDHLWCDILSTTPETMETFPGSAPPEMLNTLQGLLDARTVPEYWQLSPLHRVVLGLEEFKLEDIITILPTLLNKPDWSGKTPLHWACRRADLPTIQLLLKHNAKVGVRDVHGNTPLHFAATYGTDSCVTALMDAGADVNATNNEGCTALHSFVISKNSTIETLYLLIRRGASLQIRDHWGDTPLSRATYWCSGCTEAARKFRALGTLLEPHDPREASKAQFDMSITRHPQLNIANLFAKRGTKLNFTNGFKRNVLHFAALRADSETMKVLANMRVQGLDPDARDKWGFTPWECFERLRKEEYVGRVEDEVLVKGAFKELLDSVLAYPGHENSMVQGEQGKRKRTWITVEEVENLSDDESGNEDGEDVFYDSVENHAGTLVA